jgi:malate dehydrogenase (oxaloacetate-decarboxylating)
MKKNYGELSLELHERYRGKIGIKSKVKVENKEDLSIAYTPGIARPCLEIQKDESNYRKLCSNGNTVAVITNGTAVLGLGDIGPKASMPVMEGKALLFKEFADIDAFPIALNTKDVEEFVRCVEILAPSFGGINLEDISAPECFEIENRLREKLDIPVFHDDQHGTAIVVLAGLINSLKLTSKDKNIKIVVNGSGAAGIAITKLIRSYGFKNILVCDSKGIISKYNDNLSIQKKELLKITNSNSIRGDLEIALENADVFIGVSKGNILNKKLIEKMSSEPIIFAMANPEPEIMPDLAKKLGVKIIATGRSDFKNQLNNVLVFPGIFKGAMSARVQIDNEIKIAVAEKLASLVKDLNEDNIIPSPLDKSISDLIANEIKNIAKNRV